MAKFYGIVGFVKTEETEPGIWEPKITEEKYYGDFTRNTSKFQTSGNLNDNVDISNEISIVANPYAFENFQYIRYVEYMGTNWEVSTVQVQYPRLILSIGGVYNGDTSTTT